MTNVSIENHLKRLEYVHLVDDCVRQNLTEKYLLTVILSTILGSNVANTTYFWKE